MVSMLEAKNIYKSFGDKKVLRGLSISLKPGDIIGLVGKSGCGKSTFLKILVGFYSMDKGKLVFNGKDITKNQDKIRKKVGYTTQENAFYEKLTVYENLMYYANLYGVKKQNLRDYLESLLDSVELLDSKDKLAGDISGGMKRRLDFAISIVHDPELIILDEPTAGLDPLLIDKFWSVVEKVVRKGNKAVMMSSHILGEIEEHCNIAAIMKSGKISNQLNITKKTNLEKEFRKLVK